MATIKKLQAHHQALPALDFALLLAHAINRPKEFIFTHPEYRLIFLEYIRFKYFLFLYRRGYSVAAITGHKEFFGLNFFVNKHVLIPRPETELMVEEAIEGIENEEFPATAGSRSRRGRIKNGKIVLIDVGTGSGCIPIAIAKTLTTNNQSTNKLIIYATDFSRRALRVARRNAREHNVAIKFFRGNLLAPLVSLRGPRASEASRGGRGNPLSYKLPVENEGIASSSARTPRNDTVVITANLPYLTAEQFAAEPSIQREPRLALVAEKGGLALYEELLKQIKQWTTDYGLQTTAQRNGTAVDRSLLAVVLLEINPPQSPAIAALIKKYLPSASVKIKPDLAGQNRVAVISMN